MSEPRDVLHQFFAAENRRDWGRYVEFLHPDVEWVCDGRVVRGRVAYLDAITAVYADSETRFRVHQILSSGDASLVATLLVDSEGSRSLDVFQFEDGVIRREWEYLLGPGADWTGTVVGGRGHAIRDMGDSS